MKKLIPVVCLSVFWLTGTAQNKDDIIKHSVQPKTTEKFDIYYRLALPEPKFDQWDEGYDFFLQYLTASIMKTQTGLSFEADGVTHWICRPSAKPHVQLDTTTTIRDMHQLTGTWRAVSHRAIEFTDSGSYATKTMYRTEKILNEFNQNDAFAIFTEKSLDMFLKKEGKKNFKNTTSSKYELVSGRYLLLYKLVKSNGAIALVGIDEKGYLFFHSAIVEERKRKGEYINYVTILDQVIFKKLE